MSKPIIANHDYPYHDYKAFTSDDNGKAYQVGSDQIDATGSQRKHFVSKATAVYCTGTATIRLNHSDNVAIAIVATLPYNFESNIHTVFIDAVQADHTLYIIFEGVKPEEARAPE